MPTVQQSLWNSGQEKSPCYNAINAKAIDIEKTDALTREYVDTADRKETAMTANTAEMLWTNITVTTANNLDMTQAIVNYAKFSYMNSRERARKPK